MQLNPGMPHEELRAALLAKAEKNPEFREAMLLNPASTLEQELGSPEAAQNFLNELNLAGGTGPEGELDEAELEAVTGGSLLTTIKVWLMGNKSKFVNDGNSSPGGVRG
jgi:hypothetical protein